MKTLVTYLLEVLACSGVLLAAYTILLERRVRFRWCRAYLLLSMPLAAVIPLLRIPVWPGKVVEAVPSVVIPEPAGWSAEVVADAPTVAPEAVCGLLYLLGAAFLAALMCWQIVRIRRLRRGAELTHTERFTLVRTQEKIASFSFFRSVYVWALTPAVELQAILLHEASHVAHRHSVERIFMECLKALLWWNPFVWIAARRLIETEEFEADSDVLAGGYDMEHYMNAIFRQLFGYSPEIANGLRDSLTKKRFKMMTTQTPSRHALLRLAGTLPVVAGLLCAFSFTTRAAVPTAPETAPADLTVAAAGQKQVEVSVLVSLDKQPLPGTTVVVRGTASGTVTDKEGRARLTAPAGSVLEIAYAGCKTRQIEVGRKSEQIVSVTLERADSAKPQITEARLTDDGAIRETAPAKASGVRLNIILMNKDGKGFSSQNHASGATVQVIGSDRSTVADKEGNAFLDVPPGSVLEIKYPGYEPSAVAVNETDKNYFVLLQAEGTASDEAPIYSVDEDGVRQKPLYIIDGRECQFDPGLDANSIASIEILKNEQATARYGERGRNGVVVITTEKEKERRARSANAGKSGEPGKQASAADGEPFLIAETMPIFQGKDLKGFREWVQSQVRYPEVAKKNKIQGRVVLSFVVERDGSVSDIRMLQSPDKILSDEARRVIASSPAWTPGKQHGEIVRVKYMLPVDFRIDEDDAAPDTKEEPFLISETMPSFQGGDLNAFRMWVQQRLRYPVEALANNIQGRVVAMFVVEQDGTVSDIRIIQTPDKILSDEARRVIASSPAWTPGKQRGEVVRVRYTMPVDFRVAGAAPAAESPAPEKSANTAAEIVVVGYGTNEK